MKKLHIVVIFGNYRNDCEMLEYYRQKQNIEVSILNIAYHQADKSNIISVEQLKEIPFDLLIIAMRDRNEAKYAAYYLEKVKKIDKAKILDFLLYYACVPKLNIDRLLYPAKNKEYEGLVLGISHVQAGILANHMKHPFLNIARTHQDLYYNMKSVEYMIEHYPEKLVT